MSRDILLNQIDPDPDQPRKHFDEASLKELAQSIQANGLAVPILVRPNGERFMIVHGERRYRAVAILGWESIPAEVRDIDPEGAGWLALVENVQRNDLSPIEEALAYQARLSKGLTQEQLGQRIGKTQSYIATKLRLLKLPQPIQDCLNTRAITEGHAKQLLRLDSESSQILALGVVLKDGLSVVETKEAVDTLIYCNERLKVVEARIEKGFDHLDETRVALRAVRAMLTPEQYKAWIEAPNGLKLSYELALRIEQSEQASQEKKLDLMCDITKLLASPTIGRYRQLFPGLLPPLTGQEYVGFRNSVAEVGVLVPIVIDEHNNVIDGWQRLRAAQELGILDTVAFDIRIGLTKAEKLSLFLSLNMIRQHLTDSQMAAIEVESEQASGQSPR